MDGYEAAADLPNDLLIKIFLMLPPETLVRLRTVCKLWFSTIADPKFIQQHRSQSGTSGRIVFPEAAYTYARPLLLIPKFRVFPDNNIGKSADSDELLDIRPPGNYIRDAWRFRVTCNGLVGYPCLGGIILCNPCIGRVILIPIPPKPKETSPFPFIGIGFDTVKNDYKVVLIRSIRWRAEAAVFSLNSNSWKRLEPPVPAGICVEGSVFLNGFIHWPIYSWIADELIGKILVFDVANEIFGELQLPSAPNRSSSVSAISVVKGSLSIIVITGGNYEAWTMNEYGVVESWAVLFRVGVTTLSGHVELTFSGKVLFGIKKKVDVEEFECSDWFLYDPLTQEVSSVCRKLFLDNAATIEASLELLDNRAAISINPKLLEDCQKPRQQKTTK